MASIPAGISTVIFDLGGVIIDLAPEKTAKAFASLANISVQDVFHAYHTHTAFNAFEKGEIASEKFRDSVREIFSLTATDAEIDACWNAMLIHFPGEKLKILELLKNRFKTLLLSNTNAIHLAYVENVMLKGKSLGDSFHKAYYSHTIGMRKPDTIIFQHLLTENSLVPEQTVFLDDMKENLDGAAKLGIQTIHISHPDLFFDLFHFI